MTNVFNEAFNLQIWLNHYGSQVGIENCFVVDDGSTDGSTENVTSRGASLLRMPRDRFDDQKRAELISSMVGSFLLKYDAVIYSDADEMLIADPRIYPSLREFCADMKSPAATAIGLNVVHDLSAEGAIDVGRPILSQRSKVQFVSPMCKTLVVRDRPSWSGGFHANIYPPSFGDLYLFHLRHVDLGESIKRLDVTRKIQVEDPAVGQHHRRDHMSMTRQFIATGELPVNDSFDMSSYVERFLSNVILSHTKRFYLPKQFRSDCLHTIPQEFTTVI